MPAVERRGVATQCSALAGVYCIPCRRCTAVRRTPQHHAHSTCLAVRRNPLATPRRLIVARWDIEDRSQIGAHLLSAGCHRKIGAPLELNLQAKKPQVPPPAAELDALITNDLLTSHYVATANRSSVVPGLAQAAFRSSTLARRG